MSPSPKFTAYPGYDPDPCYHAADHAAADLCAQWRASIAAEKAAHEARRATNWSIVATFLSLITVAGLIFTILQTNGALKEARRGNRLYLLSERRSRRKDREAAGETAQAIGAAQKSANAAERQVALAEQNAQRELRAYVHMSGVAVHGVVPGGTVKVTIQVTNYGKTPARNFKTSCHLVAWHHEREWQKDLPDGFFDAPLNDLPTSDLAPGGVFEMAFELKNSMTPAFMDAFGKRRAVVVAGGKFFYTDVFGEDRESQYRLWHDFGHGQGGNMTALKSGNYST